MKWTEEKTNILIEGINNNLTYQEIGSLLSIDKNPVRLKAQRLNISSKYIKRLECLKQRVSCKKCNKSFESLISENRKFCSNSCSASYNNKLRINSNINKDFICKNCNTSARITKNSKGLFCNQKCQQEYNYKERIKLWKENGIISFTGKTKSICNWLRRYLLDKYNNKCQKCGWDKLHPIDNRPLVEINHIDGNAENNKEENLEVLCPNCHSMTPNFRARNKISARNRK